MEPQQTPSNGSTQPVPPTPANGVMVDLLHPQELPETNTAAAPVVATAPVAQVPNTVQTTGTSSATTSASSAPGALPAHPATPPVAPGEGQPKPAPIQVGTTQQPRQSKSSPLKLILLVVLALVILGGGGGAAWYFLIRKPAPTVVQQVAVQPGPVSSLAQSNGSALLAAGAATNQTNLTLGFNFSTSANQGNVIPQVEVQPVGTALTGEANITGEAVKATGHSLQLSVPATGLKDGSYQWQARIKVGDKVGPWQPFAATGAGFIVDTKAPAAPVVSTVGGAKIVAGNAKTTAARPVFVGTSEPGVGIIITVKPEGLSYTATADSTGAWTATPSDDLPNGNHPVNVAAKDAAGNVSATDFTLAANPVAVAASPSPSALPAASAAPTPAPTLAPTGDPVAPVSLIAFILLAISMLGYWGVSRRHED